MNLDEYLEAHPPRGKCKICLAPEREAIDRVLNREYTKGLVAGISKWLEREQGYPAGMRNSVEYHFRAGHHVQS